MKHLFIALLTLLSAHAFAGDKELARVTTDFDGDGKKDDVIVYDSSTEAEPDLLTLEVRFGNGTVLQHPTIIHKVGLNEASGITLKLLPNGSVIVRSVKDWGTSIWSQDMFLSFRKGELRVSGLDMDWWYRERGGKCEFNFLNGKSLVNGKPSRYSVRDVKFGPSVNMDTYVSDCVGLTDLKH